MSAHARRLAWLAGIALALVPLALPPAPRPEPTLLRLAGPFAALAAEVQWLRFHGASRRGEEARALELAESALTLDPRAAEGWKTLAAHLLFDLASREREPDLGRRRAAFEAGCSVARRGAERAQRPEELELFLGLVLADKAARDPELDRGGAAALLEGAAQAFERAARHGDAQAAALAAQLRAESGRAGDGGEASERDE